MVTSIARRVARLEEAKGGGGGGCPYCGDGGDDDRTYEITFDDEADGFEDFCPECGTERVIYFEDEMREDGF